jgi:SNF2 family DNA or RNA helicase
MNENNLHQYQKSAINHIIDNDHCGLFLDMGLGKTVSTLTAVNKLMFEELDIESILIVAPKRVAENVWTSELEKWGHLSHLNIVKIVGNEKKRKEALRQKADIHIISRDNIVWLCGQFGGSMLPFDMLIIDESSSFKSPKSNRFKALKLVQPSFKRVVLLTGTPAPNGLIDIWSQIYLLDRGERLGKTITAYREDYFRPGKRNGAIVYNYDLQNDGETRIHEKISDVCMSMKAKDYLNLPDRIDNYIEINFSESLQKKYNDFERDQVLEMFSDSSEISAVNAAALSNKLLQFANGAVYDDEKNYHIVHDLKLDALEEIIENANGKPVLIAYTFRHDLERILTRFKKYGVQSLKTDQDIKDWNAGKIKVMVMHPASGGHGLNLQAGGNIIVWFGQTWSLELYMQFNARLDRQGQTDAVIINHLISKTTVDEDVIKSLANKNLKQEGLMAAVKARLDKYKKYF